MSASKPIVLNVNDWEPAQLKYMLPKVNDKGGKSINIISKQTSRSLHISTPLLMTWGIADFVDEKGEADGKYSISLNFPNDEYKNKQTDDFLEKLKAFENQVLDDAVKNSELWFGEEGMSREVVKHMFFPIVKYSKNKDTKKIDLSKPPSIRAKVPNYSGKWSVEIYDTKENLIFPCENELVSPCDLVVKLSQVACVLQCTGLWVGGKGFGVTWKLVQCVVKPREVVSVFGKCHIRLSAEEMEKLDSQKVDEDVIETPFEKPVVNTVAEDSDDEEPVVTAPPATVASPVAEPVEAEVVVKKPAKKVVVKKPAA